MLRFGKVYTVYTLNMYVYNYAGKAISMRAEFPFSNFIHCSTIVTLIYRHHVLQ